MEQVTSNQNRAPVEIRSPSGGLNGQDPSGPAPLPPRPPLTRVDSRSSFPPPSPRPGAPQSQPRPQFQPGGPVTGTSQFGPRPGTPAPRGSSPAGPPGSQVRGPPPQLRPLGPQSIAPQQGPRPLQSPTSLQPSQRAPAPNNLQFGPRQPPQFGSVTTPDGSRPPIGSQFNGQQRQSGVAFPPPEQLPRQPSLSSLKGSDPNNAQQNKPANLDNQNVPNETQNLLKSENPNEAPGVVKGRSYSIASVPSVPIPFKVDDDRRKSISAVGSKIDEFSARSPGLCLIQEGIGSRDNIRGSKESVRSEASNDGLKDLTDRPESRLSGSKMTESFMGSLSHSTPKKKIDDDDVVVQQNNVTSAKSELIQNKTDLSDRSPSLTRSDDSPEPKNLSQNSVLSNKSQRTTPEPQRPKTPKIEVRPEVKQDFNNDVKPTTPTNRNTAKSPILDTKPPMVNKKPTDLNTNAVTPTDTKKSTPRKISSAPKSKPKDGDNDSGVDESTQGNDLNGSPGSPNKKTPSKLPMKEKSSNSLKPSLSRSSSKSATAKTPENPPIDKKKVPMNKVQVGSAPSPNIKAVKSKIGSLDNSTYKPGGGKIKIENRKLEFGNVTPKIAAKNDAYTPSGGTKKITTTKLEWNAKSKIGSLQNATYKPGGGDKKIETVKLDFRDKAKPKVASTANITHKPGGGAVKIENQKLEFKAQSKVGSLDNVKHRPGGGDVKIFDDKDYIKQVGGPSPLPNSHNQSRQEDSYYMSLHEWSEGEEREQERPLTRSRSARLTRPPRTPRTPRALSPRKQFDDEHERIQRYNERNRRTSVVRPASARDPPMTACSRRTSLTRRPAFSIY